MWRFQTVDLKTFFRRLCVSIYSMKMLAKKTVFVSIAIPWACRQSFPLNCKEFSSGINLSIQFLPGNVQEQVGCFVEFFIRAANYFNSLVLSYICVKTCHPSKQEMFGFAPLSSRRKNTVNPLQPPFQISPTPPPPPPPIQWKKVNKAPLSFPVILH